MLMASAFLGALALVPSAALGSSIPTTTTTSSSTGTAAPTATTVTSIPAGVITAGTSVTATATVVAISSTAGTPTGSIQFYFCGPTAAAMLSCAASSGNAVGLPVTLSGGSATSGTESPTAVGFYCWSAVYTPSTSGFTGSSSKASSRECFTIPSPSKRLHPSITAVLSSSTILQGEPVTDSATLTGASPSAGGNVTYWYSPGSACAGPYNVVGSPVTVTDGVVPDSQPVTFNTRGSYSWIVAYSGDYNDTGAESACEPLTVNAPSTSSVTTTASVTTTSSVTATVSVTTTTSTVTTVPPPTILTLSCNHDSVAVGEKIGCKATVVGSDPGPTGHVAWSSSSAGTFSIPSCTLLEHKASSTCSVKFTPTVAGSVTLTASYGGDSNNSQSSGTYNLMVTMKATRTLIFCRPASVPADSSSSVTCKAKVTGYSPTGEVSWSQSGTGSVSFASTACTLSKGICSVIITGSTSGHVIITAIYTGDPNNQGSYATARLTIKNAT